MAITRSGRGRPFPVDNQPYQASRGRGRGRVRGRGRGRGLIRHRSPSLPSNPTPNQHRQEEEEEEELVRNQLVPEEQESIVEEEEESVESLIESLQKESLVALVMEAISNDPHLIERVRHLAEVDPAQREIFVSQFGRQDMTPLTSETLNSFFGRYGEIENCTINVEQISGKTESRAYITFKQRKAAWEAAKQPSHRIGDNSVRCILPSLWRFPNASRCLQSPNYTPRMGCVLRYQYKLPENQYATTSSTTEEEEEPLETLLEGLGTYNLVSLVKEGLMKTPTILESLYKHAEIDPTLHIAAYRIGPYFMTNRTIVNSVFETYGEIERCMFDEDGVQVLFKHRNSAWKVLKQPYLKIGDYLTRCMRPSGSRAMLLWMNC